MDTNPMETAVRIRAARWTDKEEVVALIADALHPTPLAAWLVSDPPQRHQVLADVVGIWVEHAMFFGDIHLTDDHTAATVGFHRYRPIPPPTNYRIRLTDAAGTYADRFDLLDSLLSTRQPTEPHYHLTIVAVRPSVQKGGHGSALLAHHRSRLNRIHLPSWTTVLSGQEQLLTRYGYTARPSISLPDGPTLQPMRCNTYRSSAMPMNPARPADNRWQDFHG